jgi:hypothetical protein
MDRTYRERPNPAMDKRAFLAWKEKEWPAMLERIQMRKAA